MIKPASLDMWHLSGDLSECQYKVNSRRSRTDLFGGGNNPGEGKGRWQEQGTVRTIRRALGLKLRGMWQEVRLQGSQIFVGSPVKFGLDPKCMGSY